MSLWTLFKVGGLTLMVREQFAKLSVILKDVQVQILYPPH